LVYSFKRIETAHYVLSLFNSRLSLNVIHIMLGISIIHITISAMLLVSLLIIASLSLVKRIETACSYLLVM